MKNFEQHPLYRKILKEETRRARRLIFEYNEEQIWNLMTDTEKEDTDWLDIPDVITNRIDLRSLAKRSKIGTYKVSYVYKDNNGEKSNIFDEETEITQDDINKSIDKEATSLQNLLKYKIENDMGSTIRVANIDSIVKL